MYLNEDSETYKSKSKIAQDLINHTLRVLDIFGVPMNNTSRRLERMAVAFLAVADVKTLEDIPNTKDQNSNEIHSPKTREIIEYVNQNFSENISSGSYDDIRRKDLRFLVLGDIVLRSSPDAATNDSTRGYVLNPFYAELFRFSVNDGWEKLVSEKLEGVESIGERLAAIRDIQKVPVKMKDGKTLEFSPGKHNDLQKAIIEEFLPRYGYGAEVLYVGDTSKKYLHLDKVKLEELNFFEMSHDRLPDILAYSEERNWLYLIEAVHTSGPIDQAKLILFEDLTKDCKAEIIYVTAFLTKDKFRSYAKELAWETEVWIAENPDHLIHFNGDKFLGPYKD